MTNSGVHVVQYNMLCSVILRGEQRARACFGSSQKTALLGLTKHYARVKYEREMLSRLLYAGNPSSVYTYISVFKSWRLSSEYR